MTNQIQDTAVISPALMPKRIDPMRRRGRAYGLGERNPETLPDGTNGRESESDNARNTRRWTTLRKLVQAGASDRVLHRAAR